MLRNLDLYESIIKGYYLKAANVDEMNEELQALLLNPAALSELTKKAAAASQRYSESHLAQIWHDFYNQQAEKG